MCVTADPRGAGAPIVSVIVPALDEAPAMPALVASLSGQREAPAFEVLLVDGGSTDGTATCFAALASASLPRGAWSVLRSARRGRAAQMNAGAAAARGAGLVFLHADTRLPPGGLAAVAGALGGGVVGGGFRLAFEEDDPGLRVIAAWATLRSRLAGIHYGDQAMFVRRDRFEALGGFPDVPLFEDQRFAARLRREGRVVTLPLAVRTSARRLLQGGVVRTALRFAWLKARHAMGADPASLARGYRDVR